MTGRPSDDGERLAAACSKLAGRVDDPVVRAQLHALSGILANLGRLPPSAARREALEARIDGAIEAGDERAVIAAMRELAAVDRASIAPVDWSAASGG